MIRWFYDFQQNKIKGSGKVNNIINKYEFNLLNVF